MKLERSDLFDAPALAQADVGIALRRLNLRDRQHLPPVGGLLTADAQTFPGMAP
jgi:hypothetical protein